MYSRQPSVRWTPGRLAGALVAVLTVALVAVAPAEAAQTSSSTASARSSSATSALTQALEIPAGSKTIAIPAGTKVVRRASGKMDLVAPDGQVVAEGFTCHGFLDCGFEFSEGQTKVIVDAAAAGGVAAAVLACNAIPPVSEAVCAVIGAIGGSVLLDLVQQYQDGKCLYLSLTNTSKSELYDC